ncbi:MAG TPA: DUF4974 domain-containing protein [Aquaticitalea sp.]|nr:DUF4974 domain-containing protein [Aquaticitalea sp.]HNU59292.1 DUF4974 domain-containing protein [Aquaticitalea sp.]
MQLTDQEKKQLRQRITQSVFRYVAFRRFIKYGLGVAAILAVGFFSLKPYFIGKTENKNPSPLDGFVKILNETEVPDHIQLILADGNNVGIDEDEVAIAYSNTGEQVQIGKNQQISQQSIQDGQLVYNTLVVPYGKRSSIALSDGSKVWLNSGSKLVFPVNFITKNREVYIEGEAIFDVAKDKEKPFIVKSEGQQIEVLGTVFNVSAYRDDAYVQTVLKSGSVKVVYGASGLQNSPQSITMAPGSMASLDLKNTKLSTQSVNVEKYFSWRDGIFIFKNDSLESIMKKIARYYNMDIVIENQALAGASFSGYLDLKDNIENVIKTIRETTKFEYTIKNNKMIIN